VARAARALGAALNSAGNLKEAKTCLQEALALDELLLARQPDDSMRALRVTYDLSSLFTNAEKEGSWNEALPLAIRTARMREDIVRRDPSDQNARLRLWFAYTNATAEAFVLLNRPAEALDSLRRGRTIESSLPKGTIPQTWMARARYNEARAREILGSRAAACALFRESGEIYAGAPHVYQPNFRETQEGLKRCGSRAAPPGPESSAVPHPERD
jgi:tetratricopeptide (TPR) repeat protein